MKKVVSILLTSLLAFLPIASAQISAEVKVNQQTLAQNIGIELPNNAINIQPTLPVLNPQLPSSYNLNLLKTYPSPQISIPSLPTKYELERQALQVGNLQSGVININCNLNVPASISIGSVGISIQPIIKLVGPTIGINPSDYVQILFGKLGVKLNVNADVFGYKANTSQEVSKEDVEIYSGNASELINASENGTGVKGKAVTFGFSGITLSLPISIPFSYTLYTGVLPLTLNLPCPPGTLKMKVPLSLSDFVDTNSICSSLQSFSKNALSFSTSGNLYFTLNPIIYIPSYLLSGIQLATHKIIIPPTYYSVDINLKASKFCLDYVRDALPILLFLLLLSLFLGYLVNKVNNIQSSVSSASSQIGDQVKSISELLKNANTNVTPTYSTISFNLCSKPALNIGIDGIITLHLIDGCPSDMVSPAPNVESVTLYKHYYYNYNYGYWKRMKLAYVTSIVKPITSKNGCVIYPPDAQQTINTIIEVANSYSPQKVDVGYPINPLSLAGLPNNFTVGVGPFSITIPLYFPIGIQLYRNGTLYNYYPHVMQYVLKVRNLTSQLYGWKLILQQVNKTYYQLDDNTTWVSTIATFLSLISPTNSAYPYFKQYLYDISNVTKAYLEQKINSLIAEMKQTNNETLLAEIKSQLETLYVQYNYVLEFQKEVENNNITYETLSQFGSVLQQYWSNLTNIESINCGEGVKFLVEYYKSLYSANPDCMNNFAIILQLYEEISNGYAVVANPTIFGMDTQQFKQVLANLVGNINNNNVVSVCASSGISNTLTDISNRLQNLKSQVDNYINDIVNSGKLPSIYDLLILLFQVLLVLTILQTVLKVLTQTAFPCAECIVNAFIPAAAGIPFAGPGLVAGLLALKNFLALIIALLGDIEKLIGFGMKLVDSAFDTVYTSYSNLLKDVNSTDNCCISCWDKLPKEVYYALEKRCVDLAKQCNYEAIKCIIEGNDSPSDVRQAVLIAYAQNCLSSYLGVNSVEDFVRVANKVLSNSLNAAEREFAIAQLKTFLANASEKEIEQIKAELGNSYYTLLRILYPYAVRNGILDLSLLPSKLR